MEMPNSYKQPILCAATIDSYDASHHITKRALHTLDEFCRTRTGVSPSTSLAPIFPSQKSEVRVILEHFSCL